MMEWPGHEVWTEGRLKLCGVYEIVCLANQRRYIGSSREILKRLRNHRCHLKGGRHANLHLQRAWDNYGASQFLFRLLQECPAEQRYVVEQDVFDSSVWGSLFNISKDAHRGAGRYGRLGKRNSPEHNQRIREANLGKPSPRKGKTHGWGDKISNGQLNRLTWRILAEHLDGRTLVFDSQKQAGEGTGASRSSVKNILRGAATRTVGGWAYRKISKE